MPALIAALPAIISVIVAVIKVSAIIKALILIAATVAVLLLTKRPKSQNLLNQGAELGTKISASLPRTVCVGHTAIGPSCHLAYTSTNDSSKPNRYLYRVWQISDQPIDQLLGIWEGKTQLSFTGDVTTGWYACTTHKSKAGAACMWVRVYKGVYSGAVADATLISETGGLWTSAHKGTGLSYAIVKMDYDSDAFPNGEPDLMFEVHGAKLYDDRMDSTVVGGAGTQRLADPTTWVYNDNTALVIAQFLRGFTINGKRIVGVGAEARDLLPAMLFSAYNTCDQSVTYSGGTQKRYFCGYNIPADQTAETTLQDLMLAMDGQVFDRGGSITIWPGAVRTPVMNVAVQDIDWTAEKSWQPKATLDTTVNYVSGNFVDAANQFAEKDLPPRVNTTWEADDGGQRFDTFISMKAVNDWAQAQRLTHRIHQSSRFGGLAAFVGAVWLLELEQGDWFTLTAPRWNMVSKYFQVNEITLTQDFRVAIIAQEVSTSLDDWDYAIDEFARTDIFWAPPPYTLPVPTFTVAGYTVIAPVTGLQDFGFTLTPLTPALLTGNFATGIEVEWALTSALTTTHAAGGMTFDQDHMTVVGLSQNTSYSVRARTVDGGNRHSDWSSWVAVTTPVQDTTTVHADIVGPNTLIVYADVTGTPKTGEITKNALYEIQQLNVDLTSGVTWAAVRDSGNATFTISGTGSAAFAITGPNDNTLALENDFTLTATYAGIDYTFPVKVLRQDDQASTSGGAGGGGGGTGGSSASTNLLGNTTGSAYDTTNAVSAILSVQAGSGGQVACVAPISFKRTGTTVGTEDAYGKWQWRVPAGTWADIATEVVSNTSTENNNEPPLIKTPGNLSVSQTKTGLTNGSTYEFRFLWRGDGAATLYATSGTMTATGS